MTDMSGHHLVYGVLHDYLTGEEKPDTDDERIRQSLAKKLVEELGYDREELESGLKIVSEFNGKRVETHIELVVNIMGKRLVLIRYGAGSLVTREKAAIAAARILDTRYRIPLAIVTNGRDAELLDTKTGKILATGMDCFPSRHQAEQFSDTLAWEPYKEEKLREQALRILNVFDENLCCIHRK